jgi:PKD repeat protein
MSNDLVVDTQVNGSDTGTFNLGDPGTDSISVVSFGAIFTVGSHFDIRNVAVGTSGFGSSDLFAPALDDLTEFDGLVGDDGSIVASGGVLSVDDDSNNSHYGWKNIGTQTDLYVQFDLRSRSGDTDPDYFDAWAIDEDAEGGSPNAVGIFAESTEYDVYCSGGGANFGTVPAVDTWVTIGLHINLGLALTASFTEDVNTGVSPLTVNFTDTSTPGSGGPITGWAWDFGDGGTSTDENPTHVFTGSPGDEFVVSLTVTSPDGTDEQSQGIFIDDLTAAFLVQCTGPREDPEASPGNFTITNEMPVPFIAYFYDLSTEGSSPITGWAWDFGNGVTSTDQSPVNVYREVGVYTVSLTVTNDSGSNTTTQQISVIPRPTVASLGLLYRELVAGSSVEITGIEVPASNYIKGSTVLVTLLLPGGTDTFTKVIGDSHGIIMSDVTASDDTTPGAYGTRIWSDGANQYCVQLNSLGADPYFTDDTFTSGVTWGGSFIVTLVMNKITPDNTITIEFGDTYAGMNVVVLGYTGVQFDNKHNYGAEYGYGLDEGSLDAGGFSWSDGNMFVSGNEFNTRVPPPPITPFGGWDVWDVADDLDDPTVSAEDWDRYMSTLGIMQGNQIDDPGIGSTIAYSLFPTELDFNNAMFSPDARPVTVYADYMLYMAFLPLQYGQTEETTYLLFPPSPTIKWVGIEAGSLAVDEPDLTVLVSADDFSDDASTIGDGGASGQSILLGDKPITVGTTNPISGGDEYDLLSAYGLALGDGTFNYDQYNLGGTFVTAEGNPVIPDMIPAPWQVANSICVFGLAFSAGLGPWFGGGLHIWSRV